MSISEKIYALRTKNGVTQEVLAEKLAVSRQSVQKWESGVSLPTIDKLITGDDFQRFHGLSLRQDRLRSFRRQGR